MWYTASITRISKYLHQHGVHNRTAVNHSQNVCHQFLSLQVTDLAGVTGISARDDEEPIQAWVPERFCTVEVKGGRGSVSVANIVRATADTFPNKRLMRMSFSLLLMLSKLFQISSLVYGELTKRPVLQRQGHGCK